MAVGQIMSRTGRYRWLAILGAALAMAGMFSMATMNKDTTNSQVVWYMIIAGLGMGVMQPIYTLVVQNVAPPAQRGAATASTQFFRSIGSTVGVAVFGSILLGIYHQDFQRSIPPGTPAIALTPFKNPLLVVQYRSRLEAAFGRYPGGLDLLHRLLDNVRNSLVHGLHSIFLLGALLMAAGLLVNLFLREVPLRGRPTVPAPENEVSSEAGYGQAVVE
jgi:MFS family permease